MQVVLGTNCPKSGVQTLGEEFYSDTNNKHCPEIQPSLTKWSRENGQDKADSDSGLRLECSRSTAWGGISKSIFFRATREISVASPSGLRTHRYTYGSFVIRLGTGKILSCLRNQSCRNLMFLHTKKKRRSSNGTRLPKTLDASPDRSPRDARRFRPNLHVIGKFPEIIRSCSNRYRRLRLRPSYMPH